MFAQNHKQIDDYQNAVDASNLAVVRGFELRDDDALRQEVIKQLIGHFELKFTNIDTEFSINFKAYFVEELEQFKLMVDDELVEVGEKSIRLNLAGRLLICRICVIFYVYIKKVFHRN